MPRSASDVSRWQGSEGAVDDLVVVLREIRPIEGASCEEVRDHARDLAVQATRLATRQQRAGLVAGSVAFVFTFAVSGLWVVWYPTTAIPPGLQGQGDLDDVLRRVFEYTDYSAVVAFLLVLLGSFALSSWGLVYAMQRWLSPGEVALQLVRTLDSVVESPSDLKRTTMHYVRVEAALLAMAPLARTQFAREQRRAAAAEAARSLGLLELELRTVNRVPSTHREALVHLLGVVLLDAWERASGPLAEPATVSGRLAALGHAAPPITRFAGRLVALTALLPLVQVTWSMLHSLAT